MCVMPRRRGEAASVFIISLIFFNIAKSIFLENVIDKYIYIVNIENFIDIEFVVIDKIVKPMYVCSGGKKEKKLSSILKV